MKVIYCHLIKQYFSSNNVKWAWPNGRDKVNLHSPGLIECLIPAWPNGIDPNFTLRVGSPCIWRLFITNYTVGTLITKQYFSSNNVKWAWPNGRDKVNLHSPGLIECLCMGLTQILPSGWAIHAYGGYSLLTTQ